LVGYGCPSVDKKVVFSSKLLRKHVHLDEGDVSDTFLDFLVTYSYFKIVIYNLMWLFFESHLVTCSYNFAFLESHLSIQLFAGAS
jgi:hypothetical protein